MSNKISSKKISKLAQTYGTPIWIYDTSIIHRQIKKVQIFDIVRYAQKANSNLAILRLMKERNLKIDSVSNGEILRALKAGFSTEEIVFTSDIFDKETLKTVKNYQITINAGSIDMLSQIGQISQNHKVWLRINPGFGHGHSNKTNTGGENSKHGIWHEELLLALNEIKKYRLNLVGIHIHIGSGVDYQHLQKVCEFMFALCQKTKNFGFNISAISAGGGLSIPYQNFEQEVDINHYFELWNKTRNQIQEIFNHKIELELEPGRFLVAQAGVLVAEVRAIKNSGQNNFILIDAGFTELIRPSMYGSFHKIHFQRDSEILPNVKESILAGPLCESGDVFTQKEGGEILKRKMPEVQVGDLCVIHDTGAYGSSMSSNYNSRTLIPEVLTDSENKIKLIRRHQSFEELFSLEEF